MNKQSGREKFKKNKSKIVFLIKILEKLPLKTRKKLFKCYKYKDNTWGITMRYVLLYTLAKECGDNVLIGTNVEIKGIENLKIKNNVSIHSNCYLDASGDIEICDNVSIAHDTSIISTNHTWDNNMLPIKYNKIEHKKIKINEDVWVGAKAIILAGVEIEERSIIAAGAIVTKNIKRNTIVAGNPAKKIKDI